MSLMSSGTSMGSTYFVRSRSSLWRLSRPIRNMLKACLNISTRRRAFCSRTDHGSGPSSLHLNSAAIMPRVISRSMDSASAGEGERSIRSIRSKMVCAEQYLWSSWMYLILVGRHLDWRRRCALATIGDIFEPNNFPSSQSTKRAQ